MSFRLVSRSVWGNPGNRGKKMRKTAAAIAWQLRKRLFRSSFPIQLASGAKFMAHPDCVVSSALIYADWPEFAELMFIRSRLQQGDVVVDAGANVGHMGLLLAGVADPQLIFAFEPTPFTFRRLQENWRLNGWSEANLHQIALGPEEGAVEMPDVDHPETKNSILATAGADRTVMVNQRTLDSFRPLWQGRRIGFFKIDVEGYEDQVFRGAVEVLRIDRPALVMFESLSGSLDPAMAAHFEKAGYHVFQLGESGQPAAAGVLFAQNLFAVPEELRGELGG